MFEISNTEILVRLLIITALSGIIGLEREYHRRPAGVRTNIMVGLGSTLMTIASIQALTLVPETKFAADFVRMDPGRIAAQIIPGIGFIGAGAILRPGNRNVVGLTTAATMWVVCGMGIAVGLGFYVAALMSASLVMFTFFAMRPIVKWTRELAKNNPQNELLDYDEQ
jgi:putative Mg2+ transporter-C (MgtC) family protein